MHVAYARSTLATQMPVAAVTGRVACVHTRWSWEGRMTAGHVHGHQDDLERPRSVTFSRNTVWLQHAVGADGSACRNCVRGKAKVYVSARRARLLAL